MDPISLIANLIGIPASLLIGYLVIFVTVCNLAARLIPDDSTGWLRTIKVICKFLGVYVSNRITSGVSVNDIAKATTVVAPDITAVAKLPNPLNPESDPSIAADIYEQQGRDQFTSPALKMILMIFFVAPLMFLTSCATTAPSIPMSPGQIASHTVLDEKGAIAVETAYTAASKAAALAIRTGLITDRTKITQIGQLDRQAFSAVKAVRDAYNAANASSYASAFALAQSAVTSLLAAF